MCLNKGEKHKDAVVYLVRKIVILKANLTDVHLPISLQDSESYSFSEAMYDYS